MITAVSPGDVLAVSTGTSLAADLIRAGEALQGDAAVANHVVVAHHQDKRGTWWGISGQPGGVGWEELTRYLHPRLGRDANSNHGQARSGKDDARICATMVSVLGTAYDWFGGILPDVADALDMPELGKLIDDAWGWTDPQNPHARPGAVVCSSVAAWAYRSLGLACPAGDAERVTPADWWEWNRNLEAT